MIWWVTLATASPGTPTEVQQAALHAVNLDRGPDQRRALPDESRAAWAEACRLGWRPACNPTAWMPTCEPESADPVACTATGWAAERSGQPALALQIHTDLCEAGFARGCTDLARLLTDDLDRAADLRVAACTAGIGAACRVHEPERGCSLGDALACMAVKEPGRACELGHAPGCVAAGTTTEDDRAAATSLERGCALGDLAACTAFAGHLAEGRGLPADPERSSRLLVSACRDDHGPACGALARQITQDTAQGVAASPRELYQRGCDLGDDESCGRLTSLHVEQRRTPIELARAIDMRWFVSPSVRPFLGGSFAGLASLSVPRVDEVQSRRHVTFRFDTGAADYTAGIEDRFGVAQNHTMLSLDWRQQGAPWGVFVGLGGLIWDGAPDYLDTNEGGPWIDRPIGTYDLTAMVARVDLSYDHLFESNTGIGVSVASAVADDVTHNRITLGVTHDRDPGDLVRMRAARADVAGWVGSSLDGSQQAAGVVVTADRAMPLARGPGGRPQLALVVDGLAHARWGSVPRWLAHHAPARLAPDIGTWALLRGEPASRLAANGLARGTLELRWSVLDYHGLRRPLEVFVMPFVEVAAAQRSLGGILHWFGDGGAGITVAWGDHASLRTDVIVATGEAGPVGRFGLVLEQVLTPW